jgi:3-phosphoshikimate 1-carboxyvinyltransferase
MPEFRVKRARPIAAEIRVPGDKSISHRAVMFSALSNGICQITGFLASEDCLATMECMRKMGVKILAFDDAGDPWKSHDEKGNALPGPTSLEVHGCSMKLQAPEGDLDCGNSGTTMRLLAGILAAQPFESRLIGDVSLSRRPMKRIMEPLGEMGAAIRSELNNGCAPLIITGSQLNPIRYTLPVASAQVKSAVLLAGLFADGKTTVVEPQVTRDHTERMLKYFMVKTLRNGHSISTYGGQVPESRDFHVPGDVSSAAFWAVAAAAQPGSDLIILDVGLNPTRTGILKVLIRMGAQITEVLGGKDQAEPVGNVTIKGGLLKGTVIEGEEIPNVIDELPILAVAAALAQGRTVIRDAGELRNKESDRISAVASNLREMGANVRELYDGLEIDGGTPLKGARIPSYGDHRIAMAFAIAGLFAEGETIIEDVACVATSYPGFETELKHFQSKGISNDAQTHVISSMPRPEDFVKVKLKKPKAEAPPKQFPL